MPSLKMRPIEILGSEGQSVADCFRMAARIIADRAVCSRRISGRPDEKLKPSVFTAACRTGRRSCE